MHGTAIQVYPFLCQFQMSKNPKNESSPRFLKPSPLPLFSYSASIFNDLLVQQQPRTY